MDGPSKIKPVFLCFSLETRWAWMIVRVVCSPELAPCALFLPMLQATTTAPYIPGTHTGRELNVEDNTWTGQNKGTEMSDVRRIVEIRLDQ